MHIASSQKRLSPTACVCSSGASRRASRNRQIGIAPEWFYKGRRFSDSRSIQALEIPGMLRMAAKKLRWQAST